MRSGYQRHFLPVGKVSDSAYTFRSELKRHRPDIELLIDFEDEKAKVVHYIKMKNAEWMALLDGDVLKELKDFDDPKWDERVPGDILPTSGKRN